MASVAGTLENGPKSVINISLYNSFYLFLSCFLWRRICKFSLFFYSNLISLPLMYSYLSILNDDNVYVFAASILNIKL